MTSLRRPSLLQSFYFCFYCIVFSVFIGVASEIDTRNAECGYKGCPKVDPNKLNVHLICHTHDDVGWVKTADEYFFGANRSVKNHQSVEQILDSVVSELLKNKNRRFVYVESAFLWRWWILKEPNVQDAFVSLVKEGRLQFLGGGWVMSDEATPHYSALIDQMTLGHRFLKDMFGECHLPKVAWQIDPFGHSSEVALEFAQMGYDGLFFSRMDRQEFDRRRDEKSLEMIWAPDTREGTNAQLFTGQTFDPNNPYHPPAKLCFDVQCNDDPIIDNKLFHGYNVDKRADDFVQRAQEHAKQYKTNNVMFTMGGDFHYSIASSWFNNLDRLQKYINNNRTDINVIYSTPACYLKSLNEADANWPVKMNEDFFPYGGSLSEIWTGYYTSRPSFKRFVYTTNNFYQACKQLRIPLGEAFAKEQGLMARAIAQAQHHDAVSGTEKKRVMDDYKLYLDEGIEACQKIYKASVSKWHNDKFDYIFCPKLNVNECDVSEKESSFIVHIYNPQAHDKKFTINIPVDKTSYKITDFKGVDVPFDLIPIPDELRGLPGLSNYTFVKPCEMIFDAVQIPPLGMKSFLVTKIETPLDGEVNLANVKHYELGADKPQIVVENDIFKLNFDNVTGLLTSVTRNKELWDFKQNFLYYEAGNSGAYLFYANKEATPIETKVSALHVAKGNDVIEVQQKFSQYLSQIIRLHKGKDEIEFQWLVGPLPNSMQVITRYETKMDDANLYTDSNGRRLLPRKRGDNIEKSYYPITSAAVLKNAKHRLTILTDRPQGAASWTPGSVEIMIQRQLQTDDNKGVEEVLVEKEYGTGIVARGTHVVQFGSAVDGETAERHRLTAQDIVMAPIISFSKLDKKLVDTFQQYNNDIILQKTWLVNSLPENVHLLTLERWTDSSTILVRLEHMFEKGEGTKLSQPVTVDLKNLLVNFKVESAVELTLSAMWERSKLNRLKWKHDVGSEIPTQEYTPEAITDSLQVLLNPMEIRTFEVTVTPIVKAVKASGIVTSASYGLFVLGLLLHIVARYF